MSRAAVADSESFPSRGSLWILGRAPDLLLFVGTPLLILPLAEILQTRLPAAELALYVAAFGALGHHLPGMMRAYGDRALFERFRVRFLVAPIFLLGVCLYFSLHDLRGLSVAVLLWGVWHGALQVYGFVRIYDAKARSFARRTVRLDWLMCVLWFGAGTLFSPGRMKDLVETFYAAGGPLLQTSSFHLFRSLWGVATVVVTAAFVTNFLDQWRRGERVSFVKPLAMLSGCGFWWYTSVTIPNVILGVALFEVFHDVQYLTIVWLFNRNRSAADPDAGSFTRFLFRRSGLMIGLYVGLCAGYGAMRLLPEVHSAEVLRRVVLGVVAASTLLHFYYDGFIWKVRETATRKSLGLEAEGGAATETALPLAPWMAHALKWSAFVVPVAFLGSIELRGVRPGFEQYESLAALLPDSAYAQNNLGVELRGRGLAEEAVARYRRALELEPDYARAHSNLGVALLDLERDDEALQHFESALSIDPEHAFAHTNLASTLARRGRGAEAVEHYRRALSASPDLLEAHNGLGQALVSQGRLEEGLDALDAAVRLGPRFPDLHDARGLTLSKLGRKREALAAFDAALAIDPDRVVSMEAAAWILATMPEAEPEELARAVELGERAAKRTEYLDASVLDTLGAAYAASGSYDRAVVAARTASAIAFEEGRSQLVRDIEARLALYLRRQAYREASRPPEASHLAQSEN